MTEKYTRNFENYTQLVFGLAIEYNNSLLVGEKDKIIIHYSKLKGKADSIDANKLAEKSLFSKMELESSRDFIEQCSPLVEKLKTANLCAVERANLCSYLASAGVILNLLDKEQTF